MVYNKNKCIESQKKKFMINKPNSRDKLNDIFSSCLISSPDIAPQNKLEKKKKNETLNIIQTSMKHTSPHSVVRSNQTKTDMSNQ